MPVSFQRCTRALESDRDPRSRLAAAFAVLALGAAVVWSLVARVTVFETTDTARIEVVPGVHVIQTQVSGRVVATYVALDKEVRAGDVLLELDAEKEKLELEEERAKAASLAEQIAVLRSERESSERALQDRRSATPAALREAEARRGEAEARAAYADSERVRVARLHDGGAVSEFELSRARAEAAQRRAAAEALGSAATKLRSEESALASERTSALARLDRERARVEGDLATTTANVRLLEHTVAMRTIRAPVAGRLAQIAELQVGAFLDEGTRIGAIVPNGELRAVAQFPARTALGRVQPGQRAWLRLEGFPWTEYGKTEGAVAHVGNEEVDGRIRVELTVDPATVPTKLQHGLPATAEVQVERVTPMALLLRLATRKLTGVVAAPPPPPPMDAGRAHGGAQPISSPPTASSR